jgi:LysM repeat protein
MKRFQLIFTKLVPYVAVFALVFGIMYFGSRPHSNQSTTPLLASLNDNNAFTVTSDQVSESYTIANIATSVSLPSASTISENYITVNTLYEVTGTTSTGESTVIEKPTIIDTSSLSRGVISYTVKDGDTLDSIITKNKLKATKDQLRWSNGLKNESISVDSTLYLPTVAGIVYTVKDGDTVASLAEKYQSNTAGIIAYNDLEDKELTSGMRIILPGGILPENAQNMSRQNQNQLIPTPILTFVTLVVVTICSKSAATAIGLICITAQNGRITLAPSVTVLGLLGIGVVIICHLITGSQVVALAMQNPGSTR